MSKKIIAIVLSVLVVAAVGSAVYVHFHSKKVAENDEVSVSSTSQNAAEERSITLEIIADSEDKEYKLMTTSATLGGALVETGYVENNQEDYGLYIKTVYGIGDGYRTCDESKQEWWCITKDGQSVSTGADSTPISDGDHFELTLKQGY